MACFICNAPIAPHGWQSPGFRSERADFRRIWACDTHKPDAEARYQATFHKPITQGRDPVQPQPEGYGTLFDRS